MSADAIGWTILAVWAIGVIPAARVGYIRLDRVYGSDDAPLNGLAATFAGFLWPLVALFALPWRLITRETPRQRAARKAKQ